MNSNVIGERIRQRRQQLGLTLDDIAVEIGVARSTVQRYETGNIVKVKLPVIEAIARVLKVSPSWLCGKTEQMQEDIQTLPFLYQIEPQSFPLLGNIACGEPIFAEERFEAQVRAGARINADFCLRAEGDSMIGARIYDGDIVFVRKQDIVDNGEIAAVLIGDEATLKRVDYDRARGELTLYPENPRYRPLRLRGAELEDVRILGKAVAALADLE